MTARIIDPTFGFLSTLSLRRATSVSSVINNVIDNFYPRSPCGERQRLGLLGWLRTLISIHALLAESDLGNVVAGLLMLNFYPRSPCGERRVTVLGIQHKVGISIHALLAESDRAF